MCLFFLKCCSLLVVGCSALVCVRCLWFVVFVVFEMCYVSRGCGCLLIVDRVYWFFVLCFGALRFVRCLVVRVFVRCVLLLVGVCRP